MCQTPQTQVRHMAQYYQISETEIDEFLTKQGFRKITGLPNTKEIVYGKRVDQAHQGSKRLLTLRVYTSITMGAARLCGDDALRVVIFEKIGDQIVKLGGSKRVHRVQGWRRNLQARIDGWLDYLPKDSCHCCGKPMVVRRRRKDKKPFLACCDRDCGTTRNVRKAA